jgi:heat shock protein HslJ
VVKSVLPIVVFILLVVLIIWMPWISTEKAGAIAVNAFMQQQQDAVDGCGFNCEGCGVVDTHRLFNGYIVDIEYSCGMFPVDSPEYHQHGAVYISPFGTTQFLNRDHTPLAVVKDEIPLSGSTWELLVLKGQEVSDATHITLEFDDAYAGGYTGCNYYGGHYRQSTKEQLLSFEEVASTAQACSSPVGVMEQERTYLDAFYATTYYQIQHDHLRLMDASGEIQLVFQQDIEYPMDPADLLSTTWQCITLNGESVPASVEITIRFENNTELRGHSACRDYYARYSAHGDDLSLAYLSMQGDTCESDAELTRLENRYIDILDRIRNFRIVDKQLELISIREEVLEFISVP